MACSPCQAYEASLALADSRRDSIMNIVSVATMALEAEIDECYTRLLSGSIDLNSASAGGGSRKSSREIAVSPYIDAFDTELKHATEGILEIRNSLQSAAESLLKNADGLSRRKNMPCDERSKELSNIKDQVCRLRKKYLLLEQSIRSNVDKITRIALEADGKLGTSSMAEAERLFAIPPWTDEARSGNIVILLSDIFTLIRDIEDMGKAKDEKWVAPTSFERDDIVRESRLPVTTKYWVREENLTEVLLRSVSELPLLVYGRSGLLQENPKAPLRAELWKSYTSPISSVYYDSENMDLYKERIKRSEGAQLFRVRWYGNKPKGDENIFLELKTHHESWIENKSVKERVIIKEKHMIKLNDTSDGPWTPEYARALVKEANPGEKEKDVEESVALLLEMRSRICKFQLRPCVRTKYVRAAFQSSKNNSLRLTLDRDITVIDETRITSLDSWCLDDDDVIPFEAIVKLPYGVFEVKVSGSQDPYFIEELKESHAIVEAKKFSKFLTGASIHNKTKVNMLPWWASDPLFRPIYNKRRVSSITKYSVRSLLRQPLGDFHSSDKESDLLVAEEGRASNVVASRAVASKVEASKVEQPRKEAEDTEPSESSLGAGLLSFVTLGSSLGGKASKADRQTPIAPRSPARVEPKSFFANERTFIQWITAGLLFMTVAGLLFVAAEETQSTSALIAANWMMASSLLVALYGVFVYYRRLHLMLYAKPYGYADALGPGVFALFTIIGVSLIVYYQNVAFESPQPKLIEEPGVCVQRFIGGISAIQFEPSDIVLDEQRDLLIVASLSEILTLPAGLPEQKTPLQVLYSFPGEEDLEALTFIDGMLYAISEGLTNSSVIQMNWTSNSAIAPVKRWGIPSPAAEGMAYIPDPEWLPRQSLLIAGDKSLLSLTTPISGDPLLLSAYEVPLPLGSTVALPYRSINEKVFTQGLTASSAVVSSLQYFDKLLYMLFGNEQRIRAFNSSGAMEKEWSLPVSVQDSGKQWEGMCLQRNGGKMYMHLTLDSPPQIWTIVLAGNTSGGAGWEFPSCASALA